MEQSNVKVEETETLAESLLTPVELEMIKQMSQDVEDVPKDTPPEVNVPKDEVKPETPKEAPTNKTESKTKDVLESLLGLKKPEIVQEVSTEPLTDEQKKIKDLETKLENREFVDVLQKTLESLPEDEAQLISDEVARLIEAGLYATLKNEPLEKRVASLVLQARGLQMDAIRAKILASKEAESQTRKEYEGLSSVKGTSNEIDTEAQRLKQLQALALSGDRDATAELMGLTDPALEALIKQSL